MIGNVKLRSEAGRFADDVEILINLLATQNFRDIVVVVVTRLLGGMAEDHGAPEAGQLPRVWTRGCRETESPKSERRKESVAGQRRMR